MKKNGVFLFVISHLVPEIFKIFVLYKLGTDDVIRYKNLEHEFNESSNRQRIIKRTFAEKVTSEKNFVDNSFSHEREMTKRGALLHGVPYGVPKMEYP